MLKAYYSPDIIEVGCDEAGRGPLAGSVFAAAVVWNGQSNTQTAQLLNDSKQLTEKQRYELRPLIQQEAVDWAVAEVTAEEIDKINILQASILAMQRAIAKLSVVPQHILVDGNKWRPYVPEGGTLEIPATTIVKGDATYMSIAAASILAKTYRDDYMMQLHEQFPMYHWNDNKGYPTHAHYQAIQTYGISPFHRKTFRLYKNQ